MNNHESAKSNESTPLPTPQPPSKEELLTGINERIIEAVGGDDLNLQNKVRDCLNEKDAQPTYQEEFSGVIEQWHLGYPEINMLNILDEQVRKWKETASTRGLHDQSSDRYMAISKLLWDYRLALRAKYQSFPPETWEVKYALRTLQAYPDYPFDDKLDGDMLFRAARRFADINLVEQIDLKIIWWQENPGSTKPPSKSMRIQLWEFFEGEARFQRNRRNKKEEF